MGRDLNSHLDPAFIELYRALPNHIREQARKNYRLWKANPTHPSLHFKHIGQRIEAFSVRVGQGWRAIGLKTDDTIIWFWIGSHADYDRIIGTL